MKKLIPIKHYPLGTGLNPAPYAQLVFQLVKGQAYTWIKTDQDAQFLCGTTKLTATSSFVATSTTGIAAGTYAGLESGDGVFLLPGRATQLVFPVTPELSAVFDVPLA